MLIPANQGSNQTIDWLFRVSPERPARVLCNSALLVLAAIILLYTDKMLECEPNWADDFLLLTLN